LKKEKEDAMARYNDTYNPPHEGTLAVFVEGRIVFSDGTIWEGAFHGNLFRRKIQIFPVVLSDDKKWPGGPSETWEAEMGEFQSGVLVKGEKFDSNGKRKTVDRSEDE